MRRLLRPKRPHERRQEARAGTGLKPASANVSLSSHRNSKRPLQSTCVRMPAPLGDAPLKGGDVLQTNFSVR